MYLGSIFVPAAYLHLILSASEVISHYRNKIIVILCYVISLIFLLLNFTTLIVKGIRPRLNFKYFTDPGPLFPLLIIFMTIILSYAFYKLHKEFPRASALKKNQLKYIIIATVVGFGGGLSTFSPLFNINLYNIGYFITPFYAVIITYAIVKHQLMDINIVLKKSTVYAILAFLSLIPCTGIIIIAQWFFFGRYDVFFSVLAFFTILLASLVFLRLEPQIEEIVEKRLFHSKFVYKKTLRELIDAVITFLDEKELFAKVGDIFINDLGTSKVSFFTLEPGVGRYYKLRDAKNVYSKVKELRGNDSLIEFLISYKKIIIREVFDKRSERDPYYRSIVKKLKSLESEVCIPLINRMGQLIGIINLGSKKSGDMYSHEDLELLEHFAAQAAVALENARLHQEMLRTQQLMRRADRLSSLGSLTASLAHELRNPLVTVKTFLDLLPDRYTDESFIKQFLPLTATEVERMSNLVNGLLDFAKPKKPQFQKGDINKVVDEVIALVRAEAIKRDIRIEKILGVTPPVKIDRDQMKQVFLNIMMNALEAVNMKGTVSVATREIHKNGNSYVQVEIADTGKGIPKELLDQIFDPFFTTKDQGAGLGLAITHQIVQEHGGTIEVESVPRKGATFTVNIPTAAAEKHAAHE